MANLTLRLVKGSPLTNQEIDDNFSNLNTEIATKLDSADFNSNDILTEILAVDGSGSGLDADLLDGYDSSSAATANTIVLRDANANFAANEITANKFIGDLELSSLKKITFEGATNDNFETVVTVVDPTADRTISFPDEDGTVVLTGGSGSLGSISNDMLAGGITNNKLVNNSIGIHGSVVTLGDSFTLVDKNYDWLGIHEFPDTNLRIQDNADRTKELRFQVSGISSGVVRTLTVANASGTIATQEYVQTSGQNSQGSKTISTGAPTGGSDGDVWYRV